MPAAAPASTALHTRAPVPGIIAGVSVEVHDLLAARHFYDFVWAPFGGIWDEPPRRMILKTDLQRIELAQRPKPRILGDLGQHVGYAISRARFQMLVGQLDARGYEINHWREDHPAEREPTAYVRDPSGNLVQLVATDQTGGPLLDHVLLPVDDLEAAESFYRKGLGGVVDHYHAWRMADVHAARAWAQGEDPCAPWTRMTKYSRITSSTTTSAVPQVYLTFGRSRLGLVVAAKHIQEPPEGKLRGTPYALFKTPSSAQDVAAHLAEVDITTANTTKKVRGVPFQQAGRRFFLRDPSGNFAILECEG